MTTNPLMIVSKIRQAGGAIWGDKGKLHIRVEPGTLDETDREALRLAKQDLIPLLPPPDEEAEREAIMQVEAADDCELALLLEQAIAEWDQIVLGDIQTWIDRDTILPIECEFCGSIEVWQDARGGFHCSLCDPPTVAQRLRRRVEAIAGPRPLF